MRLENHERPASRPVRKPLERARSSWIAAGVGAGIAYACGLAFLGAVAGDPEVKPYLVEYGVITPLAAAFSVWAFRDFRRARRTAVETYGDLLPTARPWYRVLRAASVVVWVVFFLAYAVGQTVAITTHDPLELPEAAIVAVGLWVLLGYVTLIVAWQLAPSRALSAAHRSEQLVTLQERASPLSAELAAEIMSKVEELHEAHAGVADAQRRRRALEEEITRGLLEINQRIGLRQNWWMLVVTTVISFVGGILVNWITGPWFGW